jgi:HSP20 family protein
MNYVTFNNREARNSVSELRRDMDRLFEEFWRSPNSNTDQNLRGLASEWSPACDVEELRDHYLITLELAGVPKDQIKIEFQEHQIQISGERKRVNRKEDQGQVYSERRYGKFERTFTLPQGVELEKAEAQYQDGILLVYVPKVEVAKPRQIKINSDASETGLFGKILSGHKKNQDTLPS